MHMHAAAHTVQLLSSGQSPDVSAFLFRRESLHKTGKSMKEIMEISAKSHLTALRYVQYDT